MTKVRVPSFQVASGISIPREGVPRNHRRPEARGDKAAAARNREASGRISIFSGVISLGMEARPPGSPRDSLSSTWMEMRGASGPLSTSKR